MMSKRNDACSRAAALVAALLVVAPAEAGAHAVVARAAAAVVAPVVEVEIAESIERAEQLATAVRGEAEGVIRKHELPLEIDPAKPRKLTIGVAGEKFAYKVELVIERDGIAREPVAIACECTQEELLAKVREGVEEQVTWIGDGPPEDPASGDPVTGPPDTGPRVDPPLPDGGRKPLGPLGKGGIAAVVIGAAVLGTGIGLVVVGNRNREISGFEGDVDKTDVRPPGYVLLAVGSVALVTGIALIAADRVRARRRATSWAPALGPGFAGLVFEKRF